MNNAPKIEAYNSFYQQAKDLYAAGNMSEAREMFLKAASLANEISVGATSYDVRMEYRNNSTGKETPNDGLFFIPTSLRRITITNDASIPYGAFSGCSFVESITFTKDIVSIGAYAFYNCSKLSYLSSETAGEFTLSENVDTIGNYAFYGCKQLITIDNATVLTSIGSYAFYNCNSLSGFNAQNNVDLSSTLTLIESYAFTNCNSISHINIPSSVETIEEYAFQNCSSISKVNSNTSGDFVLYEGLKLIERGAFQNLNLITKIVIPKTVTRIDAGVLKGCTLLTDLTLPHVGQYASSYVNEDGVCMN